MKLRFPWCAAALCAACFLAPVLLTAQTNTLRVDLTGPRMRAPLDVREGKTTLQLCQLTPGAEYTVVALGLAYGQPSTFELQAGGGLLARHWPGRKQALRFTAPASCVELELTAATMQPLTTVPMSLSVKCESCPQDKSWLEKFSAQVEAANLSVTGGVSAQSLIRNTLVGGDCFEVANITSTGNPNSRGTFTNGATNIGVQNGMVLATGAVTILPGPNGSDSASGGFSINSPDDPDLAGVVSGPQWDLSTIEFDFVPTAPQVQFDFVFGSEEYCEYVNSQYNDAFGFFISGPGITGNKNIALITGSNTPVTTNNVNYLTNSAYYVNNNSFFFSPCFFLPATAPNECELDGWTSVFTAVADVIPCSTYHIKLAIADVGDALWSSAVFLRANSFNAGAGGSIEIEYAAGQNAALEACDTTWLRFVRGNNDTTQDLSITFLVDSASTATPGVDYAPLSSPVVIPAGQSELWVPVTVFADTQTEGPESIILLLDESCSCTMSEITIWLDDRPPLEVDLPELVEVCDGAPTALSPAVTGLAPFSYAWSTGETTDTILIALSDPTVFTVTVTDACGATAVDSVLVGVRPLVNIFQEFGLCPGDSIEIEGLSYNSDTILIDLFPGQGGDCDTLRTIRVLILPLPTLEDTIIFCAGDTILIGGQAYTESGTVLDTLPGQGAGCDTLITYTLQMLPLPTRAESVALCPGESIVIGGQTYNSAGTVVDTVAGMGGGCDTLVTYTVSLLPQPTRAESVALCPGESIVIGGQTYNTAGTVVDTVAGTGGGCDTLVTYAISILPQPTRAETAALCPGESIVIGGQTYNTAGTVVDTVAGTGGGCDTLVTYTISILPQPTRAETLLFCPGETVFVGGLPYTAPGQVIDTVPAATGCDTVVTYTLKFQTPAPSTVQINCPGNIEVTPTGNTPTVVVFNPATAGTDCVCPGIAVQQTAGLASGSAFPVGLTQICFTARDSCGQSASCCFNVQVTETGPCDIKVIGCLKYELLSITRNQAGDKTYRIRVTNNCSQEMAYVAFELPPGVTAVRPPANSVYISPSGREYAVRNPNFSPFYSIRFAPKTNGLAGGASDVFAFTLPPQSSPVYIHCIAKVLVQSYYEAYLNTFYCPVGTEPFDDPGVSERSGGWSAPARVFPNPTSGELFADLGDWDAQALRLRLLDSRGQLVQEQVWNIAPGTLAVPLPAVLAPGLYFLELRSEVGERQVLRFVRQ